MATLMRFDVTWTGFAGGPGLSAFYFAATGSPGAKTNALRTFFEALVNRLPNDVTLEYPGGGDIIDDTSGNLAGSWADTQPANSVGTGAGTYSAASGAMVTWLTEGLVTSPPPKSRVHRVRGRTFLVPLHGQEYDTNGSLAASTGPAIVAAGTALITGAEGANFRIWSRPYRSPEGAVIQNGESAPVTGVRVADKVAVLRSRRD